ncbi:MAG: dihydrolipoyl dehydrogenase, partial [Anaerolineae bacterium]
MPATRIMEIREAQQMGIAAEVQAVDFNGIMERARRERRETQRGIREAIKHWRSLDFYETEGRFVGDHALEVDGQRIHSERIFVVAGARPHIPALKGLDKVKYLTNDNVFDLTEPPASLI